MMKSWASIANNGGAVSPPRQGSRIGLHYPPVAGSATPPGTGSGGEHGGTAAGPSECVCIREVWAHNLIQEMNAISALLDDYPCVAMDTEFPGVVARPVGQFKTTGELRYQTLRCNVDLLKIIQLGLTFTDDQGRVPPGVCTWQFNFKFNLNEDMYAADSIELLVTSGIEFEKNEKMGIDVSDFGELFMASGLVLNSSIRWISFHSGYDFGYLLKLLTCAPLPGEINEFFDLVKTYFPWYYDIKYLMTCCGNPTRGLQDLANDLEVARHPLHRGLGVAQQTPAHPHTGRTYWTAAPGWE
eukprot:TRINITY_DN1167_c0_g1_i4.p1 TRINITY_DN1167_c0_g1~~TRINITY_DN1167_c0_g1_i4.p1  ORF type:complete len:324 (-),score=64.88 TRINITY_DN1167_c0_g1_i4:228-1124(-)